MKLRMPPGSETVTHGSQGWVVNNGSLIVELPDEIGRFMLADARSGCALVEDPPGEGEIIEMPMLPLRMAQTTIGD
jgi:hypothetical protein